VLASLDGPAASGAPLTYILKVEPSVGTTKTTLNASVNDSGALNSISAGRTTACPST
jgi:hypothetical protein